MRKLKLILVLLLALLILPFSVFAEDEENSVQEAEATEEVTENTTATEDNRVKIYFFRGEGCPHCQEAEEYFESIKETYGDQFVVVDYETWYNEENAALLQQIAEFKDEEISGVPYIMIGNKSWSGYSSDFNDEIIEAITSEYQKPVADRYDIMQYLTTGKKEEKKGVGSDIAKLLIMIIVAGGIVFGIVMARKKA